MLPICSHRTILAKEAANCHMFWVRLHANFKSAFEMQVSIDRRQGICAFLIY